MKSIDVTEAQSRFDELLEEAQRQPIVIRQEGFDCAIVLSMREYDLLRADSVQAFIALRNEVAREASQAGLTEEAIDTLLSDD
jgi:PHD/YefM family antitoxin component YafN of YafNO toxin-antitoxin module